MEYFLIMPICAYKVQLDVNNSQQTLFAQHIGCARWAYNWALSKKKSAFDKKEHIPSAIDLHKELNILKKTEISWMYLSSKSSPQNALRDCDKHFKIFLLVVKNKLKEIKDFLNLSQRKMRNNHLD